MGFRLLLACKHARWAMQRSSLTGEAEPVTVHARGDAWYEDRWLDTRDLCAELAVYLNRTGDASEWRSAFEAFVARLNGHFALIAQRGDCISAAVDWLRSYPLFYFERAGELCVSDDGVAAARDCGWEELDEAATLDLLVIGYVTGPNTLHPNVRQLQTAELMHWEQTTSGLRATPIRYYCWFSRQPSADGEEELVSRLGQIKERILSRVLSFSGNRPLIIPLSGGWDSRLILCILKRLGAKDVVCFSYGRKFDPEVTLSRRVARALGYPWFMTRYSPALRRRALVSPEMCDYWDTCGHLIGAPHMGDWAALHDLRGVLPRDGVVVPGHTAVWEHEGLREEELPRRFQEPAAPWTLDSAVDEVLAAHYRSLKPGAWHDRLIGFFRERVRAALQEAGREDNRWGVGLTAFWNWRERQAKYILNSVRAYDYFGYGWRLPLFEKELLDFVASMPVTGGLGMRVFHSFLDGLWQEMGVAHIPDTHDPPRGMALPRRVRSILFHSPGVRGHYPTWLSVYRYRLRDCLRVEDLDALPGRARDYLRAQLDVPARRLDHLIITAMKYACRVAAQAKGES